MIKARILALVLLIAAGANAFAFEGPMDMAREGAKITLDAPALNAVNSFLSSESGKEFRTTLGLPMGRITNGVLSKHITAAEADVLAGDARLHNEEKPIIARTQIVGSKKDQAAAAALVYKLGKMGDQAIGGNKWSPVEQERLARFINLVLATPGPITMKKLDSEVKIMDQSTETTEGALVSSGKHQPGPMTATLEQLESCQL